MSVVTQLYFQIVEENNYMFRPFSTWLWPTQKRAETCSCFLQQFENTVVLRRTFIHLISASNLPWRSEANSYLHATHELLVPPCITHSFILLAQPWIRDTLFWTTASNVCLATSSEQTALQGALSFGHMSYGRGIFFVSNWNHKNIFLSSPFEHLTLTFI
jgi:hypothetical protein